ncbi:hypothetical protein L3Q67_01055 [Saccharothrix sp. AJ9571]|nr:hypothetical protein L3Q67_01055 [Saccharothrix sp. AJ9571]
MTDVETTVDPPEVDQHSGGDERPLFDIHLNVLPLDGGMYTASARLDEDTSAEAVADALLSCLSGVAAMLGSDVQVALAHRMAP